MKNYYIISLLFSIIFLINSIQYSFSDQINEDGDESDHDSEEENKNQDIFKQDLSDAFKIDASTKGLQKVHLKCGSNSMQIELETQEDFNGVMYTRGSFYKQQEPCFVRPNINKGGRSFAMKFSFNQCQTLHHDDVYSNVVVIQHDEDLVTPGDAAFSIECNFRKPKSFTVESNFETDESLIPYGSRITLTSPDPSISPGRNKFDEIMQSVFNESDSVTFVPTSEKVHGSVETAIRDEL